MAYDPTLISIKDDRGVWLRLPRHGWEGMAAMLRDEAAKWATDPWQLSASPDKPDELRAYALRIEGELSAAIK
jgi:hypothetical protein